MHTYSAHPPIPLCVVPDPRGNHAEQEDTRAQRQLRPPLHTASKRGALSRSAGSLDFKFQRATAFPSPGRGPEEPVRAHAVLVLPSFPSFSEYWVNMQQISNEKLFIWTIYH